MKYVNIRKQVKLPSTFLLSLSVGIVGLLLATDISSRLELLEETKAGVLGQILPAEFKIRGDLGGLYIPTPPVICFHSW